MSDDTIAVSEADAAAFHRLRPRLFGLARQVLGSANDADDVVQETWLRWQGTDRSRVRDPHAFLATTAMRRAITAGQSARARRETWMDGEPAVRVDTAGDPSLAAERRDELESAVRTLVEKLSPVERAVYVLREAFEYPYRDIAQALGLSEANARQRFARARRRLSGPERGPVRAAELRRLVDAVVAASHTGDVPALAQVLADDVNGTLDVAA
jgi:RNA polymerase sigma-70 factor, ECF subfamily